jgi:tRNA nucleotidyltransferase (CCA-adding enzyme)
MAKEVLGSFEELPGERVYGEFAKWASKSVIPSAGLRVLQETGWIRHFPEIAALVDCPQPVKHHPEGCVFTHTCHCVDALAAEENFRALGSLERVTLMIAMLAHDFGKPATTLVKVEDDLSERITAHGHEAAGVAPFLEFLGRMKAPGSIARKGVPLIREHLAHANFVKSPPSWKALMRLVKRLGPASVRELCVLMQADLDGRPPFPKGFGPSVANLFSEASKVGVLDGPLPPLLSGRDLLRAGFAPGPPVGSKLRECEARHVRGSLRSRAEALEWIGIS